MSQDSEWQAAHAALLELARRRAGLELEEGRCLLAARRAEAHRQLGYGSFTEYIERLFGYSPRVTHDKLRVAAALEGLPALARALREGSLTFSHARELTRVATHETAVPAESAVLRKEHVPPRAVSTLYPQMREILSRSTRQAGRRERIRSSNPIAPCPSKQA